MSQRNFANTDEKFRKKSGLLTIEDLKTSAEPVPEVHHNGIRKDRRISFDELKRKTYYVRLCSNIMNRKLNINFKPSGNRSDVNVFDFLITFLSLSGPASMKPSYSERILGQRSRPQHVRNVIVQSPKIMTSQIVAEISDSLASISEASITYLLSAVCFQLWHSCRRRQYRRAGNPGFLAS